MTPALAALLPNLDFRVGLVTVPSLDALAALELLFVRQPVTVLAPDDFRPRQPRLSTVLRFTKVARKPVTDAESLAQQMIDLQPFTGSPDYAPDAAWLRELAMQSYERGYDFAGAQRQTAANAAAGDRRRDLAAVRVPTLMIHGEADQIIRPIGGQETSRAISGAVLVTYPGMGHNLPRELWPAIVDGVHYLAKGAALPR